MTRGSTRPTARGRRPLGWGLAAASSALFVLALLGAAGLAPTGGLLALCATTGCATSGLAGLAAGRAVERRRVHRLAVAGIADLEAWLRRVYGRAEGAE